MEKKTFIQLILYLILFLLVIILFNNYKTSSNKKTILKKIDPVESMNNEKQNIIKDIKYISTSNGVNYELNANYGEINFENPDLTFMRGVTGIVTLTNNEKIIITSNFAKFNKETFETTFFEEVRITKLDKIITGDELYLVLKLTKKELEKNPNREQNLIRFSNNIVYKKTGYILKTDVVEIDLLTKNLRIYMKDNDKKILINKLDIKNDKQY